MNLESFCSFRRFFTSYYAYIIYFELYATLLWQLFAHSKVKLPCFESRKNVLQPNLWKGTFEFRSVK